MDFFQRSPSTAWEPVMLPGDASVIAWVWFKPQHAPHGMVLRVAEESFSTAEQRGALTLRTLLDAVGVDSAFVASWTLHGTVYHGQGGVNPLLDSSIPLPPATADPSIIVSFAPPPAEASALPAPVPHASSTPPTGRATPELFAAIDADWHAIVKLERQLGAARKQLTGTLNRVNALNRDFSPDERRFADNQDVTDWIDARRWLRDVASRVHRLIKAHDVGVTSMAGQRTRFEAIYEQSIAPRRPLEGMEQIQRDFETYRKTVQQLLNNMAAANDAAARDGESRARRILSRVQSKARTGRRRT